MAFTFIEPNTTCFTINQEPLLDASSRLHLKQAFDDFTNQVPENLKIDMQGITRVNSSGLALLVELKKISFQKGIGLKFINIDQSLIRMIEEIGLDEVLFYI
jgi:anti-anti-sigma regulatory factor